ncbi:MAG: hypothetical protein JEZ08_20120 [Clostridiales bacterium]|nr:hypothetical protein [Clostridiales bacterium]
MIFLIIVFVSNAFSVLSRGRVSLQLMLGSICILGFVFNVLDPSFAANSKLVEVGFIAFNVLIIHSGTMIDFKLLKRERKIVLVSFLSMTGISLFMVMLSKLMNAPFGLLSAGPLLGGGATAAITSVITLGINPRFAMFPWLIFMTQSLLAVPIVKWAARRSSFDINEVVHIKEEKKQVNPFKIPAYYLGVLMVGAVLNQYVHMMIDIPLHTSVTALLIGIVLGHTGLLERAPLRKTDSFGLLMLGLMSLLVHTLSQTPIDGLLKMLLPLVIVLITSTVFLILIGLLISKFLKIDIYRCLIIVFSSMIGYPMWIGIVKSLDSKLEDEMMRIMSVTSVVLVNGLSIIATSLMMLIFKS